MRELDLLDVLALEHRELLDACDGLLRDPEGPGPEALRQLVHRIAVHEASERHLVHPLLEPSSTPAASAGRRSDQDLLASRLSAALRAADGGAVHRRRALQELCRTLVGCTDTDEIRTYPQVRHVVPDAHLRELVASHRGLAEALAEAPIASPGATEPFEIADRHARAHLGGPRTRSSRRTIVLPEPAATRPAERAS